MHCGTFTSRCHPRALKLCLINHFSIQWLKMVQCIWKVWYDIRSDSVWTSRDVVIFSVLQTTFTPSSWRSSRKTLDPIWVSSSDTWDAFSLSTHQFTYVASSVCNVFIDFTLEVSVKIKKHSDEAVWIRIAWGDGFSRPNHLKPTYVVHYLQTPYVFVTSMTSEQRLLLSQVRM